jgi:hypothetical protein
MTMKDVPVKKTVPPVGPPVFLKLTIFTVHGATFTFRDVRVECDNETTLGITYRAMSDSLWKAGTFIKANIAGWALTPVQRPR